jgi:hypothetical protein
LIIESKFDSCIVLGSLLLFLALLVDTLVAGDVNLGVVIGLERILLMNVTAASVFRSIARTGSIWKGDRKSNIVQYLSTSYSNKLIY